MITRRFLVALSLAAATSLCGQPAGPVPTLRNAVSLAIVSDAAYKTALLPGWRPPQVWRDDTTGFLAALYVRESDGLPVLAFAGTDPLSGRDIGTNVHQFFGGTPQSYDLAAQVANYVKAEFGNSLLLTGHSLGGSEAQFAAAKTGLKAIGFDAPPMGAGLQASLTGEQIRWLDQTAVNYNGDQDIVSKLGAAGMKQYGQTFTVHDPDNPAGPLTWSDFLSDPLSVIAGHSVAGLAELLARNDSTGVSKEDWTVLNEWKKRMVVPMRNPAPPAQRAPQVSSEEIAEANSSHQNADSDSSHSKTVERSWYRSCLSALSEKIDALTALVRRLTETPISEWTQPKFPVGRWTRHFSLLGLAHQSNCFQLNPDGTLLYTINIEVFTIGEAVQASGTWKFDGKNLRIGFEYHGQQASLHLLLVDRGTNEVLWRILDQQPRTGSYWEEATIGSVIKLVRTD